MTTTMQAIVARQAGDPEVLRLDELPVPTPGPREVLVRTEAAGVNFIETYQRCGVYPVSFPFTPGAEGCGVVTAVGTEVSEVSVGQRIATAEARATYAEHFVVSADTVLPVPEDMGSETAAALPLQGLTAHYLVRSTVRLGRGDTAVLTAASGGVGGLAIQLMKRVGATVIALTSTPEKEETARGLGADHVLGYEGFAERVRELTDGAGADVVYDSVGRSTFDESLRATRVRGTVVLFGGASGQVPPFDLQRLNGAGGLYVTRPSLAHYLRDAQERAWRWSELTDAVGSGDLTVRVGGTHPLADAAAAHRDLESRTTQGKLLLVP
ncbi:quinone oxidoreductase [Kocuria rhizophila]|uniref:quinone oxidoreductase family protein n=1 Tax=Kocuria TaxID=57493 RepID=UPI0002DCED00|nr:MULTISPECIES: quinone oxidoreductase [Kocuria]MXN62637.1 zinc-binding dehydrogenase [Bacillus sp. BGMRC0062]WIW68282.1 quinone oxidoreductase [Kocuria sp. ChxB]KUP28499.1 NADPH--quinone reductase [Kocuria rhizophila]MBO4145386.1 quinone oxidoreductase [Kocuria rhizophila]MCR4526738.1 quinone oxidoreductase [Kocuria rhizophila]